MSSTFPLYFIFDGVGPMDGEFFDWKDLLYNAGFHNHADLQVFGFDPKAGTTADVTEAVAHAWWHADGEGETWRQIQYGDNPDDICFLAKQFFANRVGAWNDDLNAEGNEADRWHDQMVGA